MTVDTTHFEQYINMMLEARRASSQLTKLARAIKDKAGPTVEQMEADYRV